MKTSLLDPEARKVLIARIGLLRPDSNNLWGNINVNQMLLHCIRGIQVAYGERTLTPKGTNKLGGMFQRFFIMSTDFPSQAEQAETFPDMDLLDPGENPTDFEALQKELVNAIKKYPAKPTLKEHPIMGEFNDWNWGRLNYTHIHHHLTQFGV